METDKKGILTEEERCRIFDELGEQNWERVSEAIAEAQHQADISKLKARRNPYIPATARRFTFEEARETFLRALKVKDATANPD